MDALITNFISNLQEPAHAIGVGAVLGMLSCIIGNYLGELYNKYFYTR